MVKFSLPVDHAKLASARSIVSKLHTADEVVVTGPVLNRDIVEVRIVEANVGLALVCNLLDFVRQTLNLWIGQQALGEWTQWNILASAPR